MDLAAALSAGATGVTGPNAYGALVLKYTAHSELALYAAVMVHREGLPITFHFDSERINAAYQEGGWEGIWWLPNDTADSYVILANSSVEPSRSGLTSARSSASSFPIKTETSSRPTPPAAATSWRNWKTPARASCLKAS